MGLFFAFSIAQELEFPFLLAFFFLGHFLVIRTKCTFNVADIGVTCGCFLTVVWLLLEMKREGAADGEEQGRAQKQ